MNNDQAFLNWAHNITAEVQRLLTAKRDIPASDRLGSDMREMQDALEGLEPADHITDAEAVKAQAERIRDLVSVNTILQRRDEDASKALSEALQRQAEAEKTVEDLRCTCRRAFYELEAHVNGRNPSTLTLRGVILPELKEAGKI